jgi:hypothetical protein
MDPVRSILLEALRAAAAVPGELRLYRSGKLPGLFPARGGAHAEAAAAALADGLVEVVRSETRGKVTTDWVRVTPRGVDFVLRHESPARTLGELSDALRSHGQNLPVWLAELRQELDALSGRFLAEVERVGRRLDGLAERVEALLRRAEEERAGAPVPWATAALDYLSGRRVMTGRPTCPLPELYAALKARQVELAIKDFHAGLRRLQDRGLLRLLPHDEAGGPPEPEYALPDGPALLYYAML